MAFIIEHHRLSYVTWRLVHQTARNIPRGSLTEAARLGAVLLFLGLRVVLAIAEAVLHPLGAAKCTTLRPRVWGEILLGPHLNGSVMLLFGSLG